MPTRKMRPPIQTDSTVKSSRPARPSQGCQAGISVGEARRITISMGVKKGMPCQIVSAGGTGSFQMTSDCAGVTELQAGGGIFADPWYRHACKLDGFDYSLSVLATVVSRPARDRAVLDAGLKAISPLEHPPITRDEEIQVGTLHAEHCELSLRGKAVDLEIGARVELIPGYSDLTTLMHDQFHGFRDDRLEVVWPILGRGKLQ